jgi:hypothetical protein
MHTAAVLMLGHRGPQTKLQACVIAQCSLTKAAAIVHKDATMPTKEKYTLIS